jgi:hypothetical protein
MAEKQLQQAAYSLLAEGTMQMRFEDQASAVVAILLHWWCVRKTVVAAKLIPAMVFSKLAQRGTASGLPAGWLEAAADALGTQPLDAQPDQLDARMREWLAKIAQGGDESPLAFGLRMADSGLVRRVLAVPAERQKAAARFVCLAGRPVSPAQEALIVVLAALWGEPPDQVQARAIYAFTQPEYIAQLAAELRTTADKVVTYFVAPLQVMAKGDRVAPDVAKSTLRTAFAALQEHVHAISAVQVSAASAVVAAVQAGPVVTPAASPAATTTVDMAAIAPIVVAAVTTAMQEQFRAQAASGRRRGGGEDRRGGRGGGGGGRGGRGAGAAGRVGGGYVDVRCHKCHNMGHYARDCALNTTDSSSYMVGSLRNRDAVEGEWQMPRELVLAARVRARVSSEPRELRVFVDTGSPVSAIDERVARQLGCAVSAYRGPPLVTLTGSAVVPVGQTRLQVRLDEFDGALGPVAVVRQLAWPVLLGLQEVAATGGLWVDYCSTPARVRLGSPALAAAAEPQRAPQPTVRVAGVQARALSAELEGVPELLTVSQLAHDVDVARQATEASERPHSVQIPAELSAARQAALRPAIDYHSEAETRYRQAYHERNKHAYKLVQYGEQLTAQQRAQLEALVHAHSTVFAEKEAGWKPPVIDCTQPGASPLPLYLRPGATPRSVAQPVQQSPTAEDALAAEARAYLETGRGVPAVRTFATAQSFVTTGGRVVHSYVDANEILMPTAHTLPSTDRQTRRLATKDAAFYNSFDLREGFSMLPLAEGSGVAACIRIGGIVIEPQVATMGIHSVPGEFNHLMQGIFRPAEADFKRWPALRGVVAETFIDDTGQACGNWDEVLAGAHFFLDRCARYGITLTAGKVKLGFGSLVYCGHRIVGRQIQPLSDYTQVILEMRRPETRLELTKMLGMVGWIQPFVHWIYNDLATLRQLLKDAAKSAGARLRWTAKAHEAFRRVREAIASPEALYEFDPTRTLFMLTDASNLAGACLFMQLYDDEQGRPVLRLVAAVAHTFTAAELNYTTPEQELAALRDGVQRYPHLVLGRTVVWLTDNTAVAELLRSARLSRKKRLRTTFADLVGMRIISVHVAGDLNVLADALSRNAPLRDLPAVDEEAALEVEVVDLKSAAVRVAAFRPGLKSLGDLRREAVAHAVARVRRLVPEVVALAAELQVADESLAPALEAAATGASWRGMLFEQVTDGALRLLFAHAPASPLDRYVSQRRLVLVVPRGLRGPVLEVMHNATAHGARARFASALASAFWWPTLAADATAFVEACDACRRARAFTINGTVGDSERDELLKPVRPGDVWELDTYEWTMADNTKLIIIGAVCKWSGFVALQRLSDKRAASAARMARHLHDTYGPMRAMHHDGGSEFKGEFEALCKRLGVLQTCGTPSNSNSQARVERAFRSVNQFVTSAITHNAAARIDLDDLVSALSAALNSTWSRPSSAAPPSTAFSRFFGRPAPFSLALAQTAAPTGDAQSDTTQLIIALANELTQAEGKPQAQSPEEREAMRAAQVRHSAAAAQAAHGAPARPQVNDLVFLRNEEVPMGKIANRVRSRLGPFRVVELLPAPPAQPLKARLSLVGDTSAEVTVFLRDVQLCGPALQIDDPVLRTLPPSGFFVSELVQDEAPAVRAQLQAIVDQALPLHQRQQLQEQRAAQQRHLEAAEAGRRVIALEEDGVGEMVKDYDSDDDENDYDSDEDDEDEDEDDGKGQDHQELPVRTRTPSKRVRRPPARYET